MRINRYKSIIMQIYVFIPNNQNNKIKILHIPALNLSHSTISILEKSKSEL